MDKITYLAELAEGLARWVPERERRDILRWYAEYFEEAGPEREAEVVAELGDPWALSCRLAVEGGYVTPERAASWRHKIKWPGVLIGTAVGLSIFALVFAVGLMVTNAAWNSSGVVQGPLLIGEAEPVTVVDWDMPSVWNEFEIGYGYMYSGNDVYFISGENVVPFCSIDVDISLGNIEVLAGDDFTLSIWPSDALSGYEPTWEVKDGVLRLQAGSRPQVTKSYTWDDWKELFNIGQMAMDVTITVPQNVALDKISVKTGLGDVLLYGVNAEIVTAETGTGDVECYGARNVRRLELNTGVGDVGLVLEEVCRGLYASLNTGVGDVEASLGCSEAYCDNRLSSGLGAVTVNGSHRANEMERSGNTFCTLIVASGVGDVSVYFN